MTQRIPARPELDDEAQAVLGIAIRTLAEISYRLRVANEQYRGRAFAEAAQSLIAVRPDLVRAAGDGRLRTLPGVGGGIERVLLELLDRGSSGYLQRLREEAGVEPEPPRTGLSLTGYQGDLHLHTTWSDGRATLPEMVAAARSQGYRYLAITDHSARMTIVHGLGPERLAEQRREIDALQEEVPELTILQGIEVDILEDGSLDLEGDALLRLDVVVASPHLKLRMEPARMTERMLRAIEHPAVTILGHPTGRRPGQRQGGVYDTEAVFKRASQLGVAVELDCDPNRVDLDPDLAVQALSAGCTFAMDSDAHAPRDFGYIELGLWCPELAQIPEERILNWRPLDGLRELRRERR